MIAEVEAIDVHGHFGVAQHRVENIKDCFMSEDMETVIQRVKAARTKITMVLPLQGLMLRGEADPLGGNEAATRKMSQHSEVRQWVLVDPLKPVTYEQAKVLLKRPSYAGMKIYSEEHGYHIRERDRELFTFAAEQGMVIITYSVEANSMPEDYVELADEFPGV